MREGGCLYISGPPGTGKSALVDEVCGELDHQDAIKTARVNCVNMHSARDVYAKLVNELCQDSQVFRMSQQDRLKALFLPTEPSPDLFLITLDEIDHLLTTDSEVLYSLFEWSLNPNSHLILIGIANALDLTDRVLPRLKANNLKPRLLPFLPYTAPQITNVIAGSSGDFVPFLQPAAIQLCAKKVASQTGDLRKAFELVRRAVDIVEQEVQQKQEKEDAVADQSPSKMPLVENMNLTSPPKTPTGQHRTTTPAHTVLTAPRASIAHISRITSAALGQGTRQRLQGLNLQQKAALCALVALDRKKRSGRMGGMSPTPSTTRASAPTVKQLFDAYCALCRADNLLHPLTATEFKDVISSLETMGLVGEFQSRGSTVAAAGAGSRMPSGHNHRNLNNRANSKMNATSSPISTPRKLEEKEKGLACFVTEKEIESQISGPGEGILRTLLYTK
jgi:cell division control protein 6